ncbi:MAG: hypothetical protein ACXABY_17025 [Candidatus Thorarchaeota archaeon]|jgi:hypothetical protein
MSEGILVGKPTGVAGGGGSLGKSRDAVEKTLKEVNARHSRVARIYNSPLMKEAYTPPIQVAMLKWLERFAGFIQALVWVLNEDAELPDQYYAIPDS